MRLIDLHAPEVMAGLLAAGVFAAVMSSLDSQSLSVGTMFTQDVVRHYGFHDRMSERQQVLYGRLFVALVLIVAYVLAQVSNRSIFQLGVWSFTGFASLFPVVAAAVFWRRSTRWGAFASIAAVVVLWTWFFVRGWQSPDHALAGGVMPVAVILAVSVAAMVLVSLATKPPDRAVVDRFFPGPEPRCASPTSPPAPAACTAAAASTTTPWPRP